MPLYLRNFGILFVNILACLSYMLLFNLFLFVKSDQTYSLFFQTLEYQKRKKKAYLNANFRNTYVSSLHLQNLACICIDSLVFIFNDSL